MVNENFRSSQNSILNIIWPHFTAYAVKNFELGECSYDLRTIGNLMFDKKKGLSTSLVLLLLKRMNDS